MRIITGLTVAGLMAATTVIAHEGVRNPAVKARMHAMGLISQSAKTIGDMAKGTRAFDATAARSAAVVIAQQAALVPDLFRAKEDDPKSEAKPEIWSNYGDFAARAKALETAAELAAESISTPKDLATAFGTIGQSCGGCHRLYKD